MQFKISDSRLRKRQNMLETKQWTPPKLLNSCYRQTVENKRAQKLNYEYRDPYAHKDYRRQLLWQEEEFKHTLGKMIGRHELVHKMADRDKWRLREQLGLKKIGQNPTIKQYNRVEGILRKVMLASGWVKLASR